MKITWKIPKGDYKFEGRFFGIPCWVKDDSDILDIKGSNILFHFIIHLLIFPLSMLWQHIACFVACISNSSYEGGWGVTIFPNDDDSETHDF